MLQFTSKCCLAMSVLTVVTAYILRCTGLYFAGVIFTPEQPLDTETWLSEWTLSWFQQVDDGEQSRAIEDIFHWYVDVMERIFAVADWLIEQAAMFAMVCWQCAVKASAATMVYLSTYGAEQVRSCCDWARVFMSTTIQHMMALFYWLQEITSKLYTSFSMNDMHKQFVHAWRQGHYRWLTFALGVFSVMAVVVLLVIFRMRRRKYDETQMQIIEQTTGIKAARSTAVVLLWRGLVLLVPLSILASLPWEFVRLYQMEVAKKAALASQGPPSDCLPPSQLSWYESVRVWGVWLFSWNSPCHQYHQAVLVDPLWHVSPALVLTSSFSRCIFHPLEVASSSLAASLRLLLGEIPLPWQPVVMAAILVFTVLGIIMSCRYRLSLPLVRVEPAGRIVNCGCREDRTEYIMTRSESKKGGRCDYVQRKQNYDVCIVDRGDGDYRKHWKKMHKHSDYDDVIDRKTRNKRTQLSSPFRYKTRSTSNFQRKDHKSNQSEHRRQRGQCWQHDSDSSHDDSCLSDYTYVPHEHWEEGSAQSLERSFSFDRSLSYSFDSSRDSNFAMSL